MSRIRDEDLTLVREKAQIDTVVGEKITLVSAGTTSLKGLCPFHDEKTPSLQVDPIKGLWHCFGCGVGGDSIDFVRLADGLSFVEAIEKLADMFDITLHYEESSVEEASLYALKKILRRISSDAHKFYRQAYEELPSGHPAKKLLSERGFSEDEARIFEVGYADGDWRSLTQHLFSLGYSQEHLEQAGLSVAAENGAYDRFRNRLLWPIMDPVGNVIGFGGRKLDPEDNGPKYLNSPETPLYRKSQVLYHLDEARKHVGQENRIVIVEGYTDVMAFYAAGVKTAIATCGTAFGVEHVQSLRRIIGEGGSFQGDIIFTFDGDEAGQKAAVKSFGLDNKFTRRTSVAVAPDGLDPCDLRLRDGDNALVRILENRTPIIEFVLSSVLKKFSLENVEQRTVALESLTPILAKIEDDVLRATYDRWVSDRLGIEAWRVAKAVRETVARENASYNHSVEEDSTIDQDDPFSENRSSNIDSASFAPGSEAWLEREALKCFLQYPWLSGDWLEIFIEEQPFLIPEYASILSSIFSAQVVAPKDEKDVVGLRSWLERVRSGQPDTIAPTLATLSMEPLSYAGRKKEVPQYVNETFALVIDGSTRRNIETIKSKLANIDANDPQYVQLYQDLFELEKYRKSLKDSLSLV